VSIKKLGKVLGNLNPSSKAISVVTCPVQIAFPWLSKHFGLKIIHITIIIIFIDEKTWPHEIVGSIVRWKIR
jgi:hypothetical protein